MAAPNLTLAYADFVGEIGVFLGYGAGAVNSFPAWSTRQAYDVARVLAGGMRNFYYPNVDGKPYSWSFLMAPVALVWDPAYPTPPGDDAAKRLLPDNFGGIEGDLYFQESGNLEQYPVRFVNKELVRAAYYASPGSVNSGRPVMAAVEPASQEADVTSGLQYVLYVHPQPEVETTFIINYRVNPPVISEANPYPLAGQEHSQTMLESCLAVAEVHRDDQQGGPHAIAFRDRLLASVAADRGKKGEYSGYNGDRSYWYPDGRWCRWPGGRVTVNGVLPD